MIARVLRVDVSSERIDAVVDAYREIVRPIQASADGLLHHYVLGDRTRGEICDRRRTYRVDSRMCFNRVRSACTSPASRAKSSSLMSGRRRRLNTTSQPSPWGTTRIGL